LIAFPEFLKRPFIYLFWSSFPRRRLHSALAQTLSLLRATNAMRDDGVQAGSDKKQTRVLLAKQRSCSAPSCPAQPLPEESGRPDRQLTTIPSATHSESIGRKRGPVPKRRFQKGSFQVQNGKAYTLFYRDVETPDGTITTERARHFIGDLRAMSERAARRDHDLFMAEINRLRGSVPAPVRRDVSRCR
jgi:hypothetical protein